MHVLNILIDNLDIQLLLNVWVEILFYPFDARLIDVLRDLVPFVQFQKLEGGGVTKSNTPNGCFSPF